MGIVWEASQKGVPLLGVPGITLDWMMFPREICFPSSGTGEFSVTPGDQVEARRNAPSSIFARGDAKLGDVQRLKNTRWKTGEPGEPAKKPVAYRFAYRDCFVLGQGGFKCQSTKFHAIFAVPWGSAYLL